MKKVIVIMITFLSALSAFSIDLPLMSFGMKTYSAGANDLFGQFYFDGSYNNAFVTVSQKLGKHCILRGETDFVYKSCIAKADLLTDLRNYIITNKLSFTFHNKYLRITAALKPIAASAKSVFYYKQLNYLSIRAVTCKYLTIDTIYQNQFMLKSGETMAHKLQCNFTWHFAKTEYMHFRGGMTFWFQHGIYETKNIPALKKATVNLYCVIDFNKINFEKAFNEIEDKFKEYDDFE
ncbi:MAG: hypothetical protein IKQ61_13070 [Spirochaetales bacterium]|nr:hypothetical protein [Spirochaetales bacterium]MBR6201183.1 hypothetical protein [Spirochaetales bacterium]